MAAEAYWATPITYLPGVGPKRAEVLATELGVRTFADLRALIPFRYITREHLGRIADIRDDGLPITVTGTLSQLIEVPGRRKRVTSALLDSSGALELVWFEGAAWIKKSYKAGDAVIAYGKPTFYNGRPQLVHPELERLTDSTPSAEPNPWATLPILPVYASTDALRRVGLDARGLRKLVWALLAKAPAESEPDPLPASLIATEALPPLTDALREVHFPPDAARLEAAQRRVKFDELFYFQLILARRRAHRRTGRSALPFERVGELFHRFYETGLPFPLTEAQKRVVREIRADLARPEPMNRLVQGDVGSGKTMVALLTLLIALDSQCQVAVLAPTEILVDQHLRSFTRYLDPLGVRTVRLTGSTRVAARRETLALLANGAAQVVVGTHSLLEPPVQFARLGLTVIDEQHKFGVMQRAALWAKASAHAEGRYPHNLALTATPIPRTLALTAYGEVDVSVIDELPPGRRPIRTVLRTEGHRLRVLGFVSEQLAAGRQAYVVYPLIEDSQKSDLLAAESGFEFLQRYFAGTARVGLMHGRLSSEEKEKVMRAFVAGQVQVLVATTVIEVGVDVPNATVMLIENPERFGLSQLHQLRGRVGRGGEQSFCILMGPDSLSREGRTRLNAMVETSDGFRIAEVDLSLRGPGDFLGTRQSGLPEFRMADLVADAPLVARTRELSQALVTADPDLSHPEHRALAAALERYSLQHKLELWVA
jgi:ATP-dependent DNA helicase RecG